MKVKDVVIGLIVLVVLITGAILLKNARNKKTVVVASPTPNFQRVETKFPSLNIPANADRTNLYASSGFQGMGEAIRSSANGKFTLTVVADLGAPKSGYFYQAWITNGTTYLSLGKMSLAKGGYISDFTSVKDYSGYKKVVVTEEKVFNNSPETQILSGSF